MADPDVRDVLITVASFARTRWGYRFGSRAALLTWQRGRVRRFLGSTLPKAPFYGRPAKDLAEVPVIDRSAQRQDFAALNTRGIPLERALAVAVAAERSSDFDPMLEDVSVRMYEAADGARNASLLSRRERAIWVGAVLARGLSNASLVQALSPWRRPLVITLVGARGSGLFDTLPTRRMRFSRIPPAAPVDEQVDRLNGDPPDVLVGPPSALLRLAEAQRHGLLRVTPRQVILVAEAADEADGQRIRDALGADVRVLYQAPEGMLAYTCPRGTLHLAEEHVRFEKYWLDEGHTRFVPVITAFLRDTQLVVRVRLDDVLRLADSECGCRWRGLAIAGVDGRTDAVLSLPSMRTAERGATKTVRVFPDQIAGAISPSRADGLFEDWRVELRQDALFVSLLSPRSGAERAVERALDHAFADAGADAPDIRFEGWRSEEPGVLVQRVRTV